ncbi:branched-chain amino acid transport protein AzlD [Spirochaetia bacterium]|nr:branched-chain amino acid transport protein AzlD [Spirochaetia bacterium]
MLSVAAALVYTCAMGVVVFFCRAFPFLFFRKGVPDDGMDPRANSEAGKKSAVNSFLSLIEKVVPPAAMTVLAFNSIAAPVRENLHAGIPVIAASLFTALVHLWKRNFLVSILGGTVLYMVLSRMFAA